MRVLSAIGPGDVVAAYRDWQGNVRTLSETSITFSSQEFEFFKRHGIAFWAISSAPNAALLIDGENRIENRPRATTRPVSGLAFHTVQLLYALSLWISALRFRATHAVVDSGTTHWFALVALRLSGITVVPNFHNTYWPAGHPPDGLAKRAILWLDQTFFRLGVKAALGVSPECGRQVAQLSSSRSQYFDYRAQFPASEFMELPKPVSPGKHVRVMFAGRVEESKGVFDLLKVCKLLSEDEERDFVFEVCGHGSASEKLAVLVQAQQMGERFVLRGNLGRKDLLAVYARSHVVVVPTRSDFIEGLAMVCAEAMLAGRPVVTSKLVPALELMRGCALEAREEDPADYARQIRAVVSDSNRYQAMVRATTECGRQFVDGVLGLDVVLERCLCPGEAGGGAQAPDRRGGINA